MHSAQIAIKYKSADVLAWRS